MYPKRLPRFGLVKICDLVTLFNSAEKEDYKNVISCAEVLFLHQLLGSGWVKASAGNRLSPFIARDQRSNDIDEAHDGTVVMVDLERGSDG